MPEYRVEWAIDVDRDSPRDAAMHAEMYMGESGARTFVVREWKCSGLQIEGAYLGEPVVVDLDDEEDE